MKQAVAVGLTVLAGAALLEAALIPGVIIGGAAVLAPAYLPKLRRRLSPLFGSTAQARTKPAAARPNQPNAKKSQSVPARFGVKQAVAKTITFRIIVTTLDFSSNLLVIGEVGTAAGLSAFALVAGPLFYFAHEAAWNYYGPPDGKEKVAVRLPSRSDAGPQEASGGLQISRALAKTITFRTLATIMDFSAIYIVVGDLATAAGLSAFAFVVGPFVYLGHEKLWDYYTGPRRAPALELPPPQKLLPAPA
jgi:uncharacterized membrane protein